MKITKQARREAKLLFRTCFTNGQLDEARVKNVVARLVETKPRGYVAILTHFQRLLRLEEARRATKIESAVTLAPELGTALKTSLEKRYGRGLNYTFQQRPDLLGGLRIQVGSDVYDNTIQARLNALKESFNQ